MRAVKKPIPIDVVEFNGMSPLEVKTRRRHVGDDDNPSHEIWNAKHESWIGLNVGDYINVTDLGDTYPIARDVFARTYDVLPVESPV